MSSYQYAGNNPVMFNDPLGDLIPNPTDYQAKYITASLSFGMTGLYYDDVTGNCYESEASAFSVGGNYGADGGFSTTGDLIASINYIDAHSDYGGHTSGLGSEALFNSDQDVITVGAIYMDKFNAWGTQGFANSYAASVFAYDISRPKGTAAMLVGDRSDTWITGTLQNGDFTIHSTYANQGGGQYPMGAIGGPVPRYGNFLGPGPDGNPYQLKGYNGQPLRPIDMLDAAAQRHDLAYYKAHTGGVKGALFDDAVGAADRQLAASAHQIDLMYNNGINDSITNQPIGLMEYRWALRVEISFGFLGGLKWIGNTLGH